MQIACRAVDTPILPDLLDQIPAGEETGSVTADGSYDTCKCYEAIAARGATTVIPPRKNATPWKPTSPGAVARNEVLRAQSISAAPSGGGGADITAGAGSS